MEELVSVMEEIRDLLIDMNGKLDLISMDVNSIRGTGIYDSLSDIYNKLDEIKGDGIYSSVSDVCDKLDSIETTIDLK